MTSFSSIVFRNTSWGILAQISIKILSFLFSVFVVRNLGAQHYGQYAAVLAFTGAFAVLSDMGLGVYAVRQVARWRADPSGISKSQDLFADVIVLRLLLSFLTSILLVASAWFSGRPTYMVTAIGLNSLSIFIYAFQAGNGLMLAGYERLDISARAHIWNQVAFVVVGSVVLYFGLGYLGLILANLISILLMAFITWRGVRGINLRLGKPTPRAWRKLLKASLPFAVIGLALGLSYQFDTIILSVFRGDLETGYYNAAYNLVFTAFVISGTINSSMYPSLTREFSSNPKSLPRIISRVLRYLFIISLPIAFGAWSLSGQLVEFLFNLEFLPTAPALAIVIWSVPFMFASNFLGYIVLIKDHEIQAAKVVAISTSLNIVLNLLLVPRYGYLVAAAVTVVTEVILVGQYIFLLRNELRGLDWVSIILRPLAASMIMTLVVVTIRSSVPLAASVMAGALSYAGLLLVFKSLGTDEISFLLGLLQMDQPTVGASSEKAK